MQRPTCDYDRKKRKTVQFAESLLKGKTRGPRGLRKMLQSGKLDRLRMARDGIIGKVTPA